MAPNRVEEAKPADGTDKGENGVECDIESVLGTLCGTALRACTPTGDDARRRIMFPATAMDKTANVGILESEQENMNRNNASRCIVYTVVWRQM